MTIRSGILAILAALAISLTASSCTAVTQEYSQPSMRLSSTRPPDSPILGTSAPLRAANAPECVEPAVKRTPNIPTAEFVIEGQPGDIFAYEIVKKDGATVTGTGQEFGPLMHEMLYTTGVLNADIRTITISAQGRTGLPGKCTITTIR
jgi:hypothetical protein